MFALSVLSFSLGGGVADPRFPQWGSRVVAGGARGDSPSEHLGSLVAAVLVGLLAPLFVRC